MNRPQNKTDCILAIRAGFEFHNQVLGSLIASMDSSMKPDLTDLFSKKNTPVIAEKPDFSCRLADR